MECVAYSTWGEVYPACPVAIEGGTGVNPIFLIYLTKAYCSWVASADGRGVANVKYITYFLCNCEIFYTIMRPDFCNIHQR